VTSIPLPSQKLFGQINHWIGRRGSVLRGLLVYLGPARLRDEFARLRPVQRGLIIGLAAWITFVVVVTIVAIVSVELSGSDFHAFGLRASAEPSSGQRPPADYEVILQRPLFSRSRQAATVILSTPTPPPARSDQNIVLKGVFMNGVIAKAFLTSTQNPLGTWIETNGEIAGWRVVSISPDQVVLNVQNEKMVVPLGVKEGGDSALNGRLSLPQKTNAMPARFRSKMMIPAGPEITAGAPIAAPVAPLGINGAGR
jgi:hypothetical protein